MRQHVGVFMLMVRSTIWKLLGLLVVMAAAEFALFWMALGQGETLEQTLADAHITWAFGGAFLLLTAALCRIGCEHSSKQGYTLGRLPVSERGVFLWQGTCNACCYFLLWAGQLFWALALCKIYRETADPSMYSNQTVFLAFYRSSLLHSLLPLEEVSRWIRNIILLLGLGLTAAYFPYRQRRKHLGVGIIVLAPLVLLFFVRGIGYLTNDVLMSLVSLAMAGWAVYGVFREEEEENA